MRRVCPVELKFDTAIERAKESLRKFRQRNNESIEDRRQQAGQAPTHTATHPPLHSSRR